MDKSLTHTDCFSVWLILTLHVLVCVNLVYISAYRSPWIIHTWSFKTLSLFFYMVTRGFFSAVLSLHTSPEKACPFSRCSEPWPSSLPKCSRISSRRWLYVIGPPEMLTRCSLSNRRETWRPVLYIVPPTWRRTNEAQLITQGHNRIPKEKIMLRFHQSSFLVPLITVCNVPKP